MAHADLEDDILGFGVDVGCETKADVRHNDRLTSSDC